MKRIAYKLFRLRKDGTIGSLFINTRARLPVGEWMRAETCHTVKGFAYRPGWHATARPEAPHLSMKNRAWFKVEIEDFDVIERPKAQGGLWFLSKNLRIIGLA